MALNAERTNIEQAKAQIRNLKRQLESIRQQADKIQDPTLRQQYLDQRGLLQRQVESYQKEVQRLDRISRDSQTNGGTVTNGGGVTKVEIKTQA